MTHEQLTPAPLIEEQVNRLMSDFSKEGFKEGAWDKASVTKTLELFWPAFKASKVAAVYAKLGPCPGDMDDCDEECELPNTLALVPMIDTRTTDFRDAEHMIFSREQDFYSQNPNENQKRIDIFITRTPFRVEGETTVDKPEDVIKHYDRGNYIKIY